jgi:hypothetical protein
MAMRLTIVYHSDACEDLIKALLESGTGASRVSHHPDRRGNDV